MSSGPAILRSRGRHHGITPSGRSLSAGLHAQGWVVIGYPLILAFTVLPIRATAEPTVNDTLWFGGVDPETGLAVLGGIWDFEDGTHQGWTSVDRTDEPLFFHHVAPDSHLAHGDPVSCVISEGGSRGSLWCGAHEDQARAECWPGGQGYDIKWGQWTQNLQPGYWECEWGQAASKTFTYSGVGNVTLSFDYFVDCELGFDLVLLYVHHGSDWIGPLNQGPYGPGYSGSTPEGSAIGSPDAPAHDTFVLPEASLPAGGGAFDIVFAACSDQYGADGDRFHPLDTTFGFFGIDNVMVRGDALADTSDFEATGWLEGELDGWRLEVSPPIGQLMKVCPLDALDEVPSECTISGFVLVAADTTASADAHPYGQRERLISNPVATDPIPPGNALLLDFDAYTFLSTYGRGDRVGISIEYYPWTCPETGGPRWSSVEHSSWVTDHYPFCRNVLMDLSEFVPDPASVDSLRLVFEMIRECSISPECYPWGPTNSPPYLDNIRLGFVESVIAVSPPQPVRPVALDVAVSPSPMAGQATIRYRIDRPARVEIDVFDVTGRQVRRLQGGAVEAGTHHISWHGHTEDGRDAAAGVYFLRASVEPRTRGPGITRWHRVVLVR